MDRDGTKDGFDVELLAAVADAAPVPVIASGGAGTLDHFADAVVRGRADAVLAASVFHDGVYTIAAGQGGDGPRPGSRSASRLRGVRTIRTEAAPAPVAGAPYSQAAAAAPGEGEIVWVSGQLGIDPADGHPRGRRRLASRRPWCCATSPRSWRRPAAAWRTS